MIHQKEGLCSIANINPDLNDTIEQSNYKNLLNKELQFCISNKEKIIRENEKIYTKQINNSGKVYFSYCDFKKLEETRDT